VSFLTTVSEIASEVRSGRASAAEVLEPYLQRGQASRERLNALVATREDDARAEARRIDIQVRSGVDPGPLAGAPFTVKDVLATAELPTTCGSRAMAGYRTAFDATVVSRLRRAGAILVGKTNTPEFAFGIHTDNELYGETHNPLGPFTVGGSSGGEGASVAAGLASFGVGTDFGGSLRWPAQCTALVGLRPSVGLVPQHGQVPKFVCGHTSLPSLQALVQVIGPLTRDVADAALVLSVMAGGADSCPPEAAMLDVDLDHVEVFFGVSIGNSNADPDVAAAVLGASQALRGLGATLTDGLPESLHEGLETYNTLRDADAHEALRQAIVGREDQVERRTQQLLASHGGEGAEAGWARRRELMTRLESFMGNARILLLPVSTCAPFVPGERSVDDFTPLAPSRAVSLFGLPSVSVPWTATRDGRPISVQVVAPRMREGLALRCARALEVVRTDARMARK
jgi:amidase